MKNRVHRSVVPVAAALSALLLGTSAQAQVKTSPAAPVPNASFEDGLKSWTGTGDATADMASKSAGEKSLLLRRDPVNLPETKAVSDRFAITPGVWELSGAVAYALYSPDASFNVSITIRSFDPAGKELKARRLLALYEKADWKPVKERVEISLGAATAALEIMFNKTHGEFRIDNLALGYAGASVPMEGGDRKVTFQSNRPGFLFYPGDHLAVQVTVETPASLSGKQAVLDWEVTDYWKAPVAAKQRITLESQGKSNRGWNLYRSVLELGALALEVGPYYEIQTRLDLGADTPARDTMSFAVLPESVTKDMDPLDTPFGAHTWNATVYEYFPLAARLGIRRCLVFWDWPNTAPYTPEFDEGSRRSSRLEWPKRFGLAPYGVLYPVIAIEHRENKQYTDEALRAGVRQSIEKYRKDGLWGFQIGNEPPGWNPEMVKRDVEAYKAVYEEIKKSDPSVVAIGSAIGPSEDFFKAGFQHYQDAYNLHAYSDLGTLRAAMKQYKELFKKYGGEKPIWSTEIGSK
ncbi:MAG TPA: hypothetical protein VIS74_07070, partial [Chthoniobacterales bacterium]